MQRRSFIKAVGGIGSAGALGVGVTLFASSPVSASSDIKGKVQLSSDTGEIDHVSIYGDGYVQWKGLEEPATDAQIQTYVTVADQNGNELVSKKVNDTGEFSLDNDSWGNHDEELSGTGTRGYIQNGVGLDENGNHDASIDWAIVQASDYSDPYGLPSDPIDAAYLSNGEDGTTSTFTITVTSQYHLFSSGGSRLQQAEATSTFNVDVTNIAAQTSTGSVNGTDGTTGGASNDGELYD